MARSGASVASSIGSTVRFERTWRRRRMPEFSSHAPGTFCWPELATTDQKSAVAFYRALFGWDVNEVPLGPGEAYAMFQLRGKPIAAAHMLQAEQRKQGVPPNWG